MAAAAHTDVDKASPNQEETHPDGGVGELYAAYRDRLLRFVLPRLHGDGDAAEDIVQESFAAALASLSGFQSRSSPYTWLCSIAQHKVADYYRRRPQVDSSSASEYGEEVSDDLEQACGASTVESWFEKNGFQFHFH